jgi:site-specific recombinase XerD
VALDSQIADSGRIVPASCSSRKELVLTATTRPWVKLPVRGVIWAGEQPRTQALRVTEKGYRRGCKPGNAGRSWPADPPTPEEVLAILNAERHHVPAVRLRNRALIVILWRAGLRIHEALLLRPEHVDLERLTVTILRGKGGKRRTVGFDPGAVPYLVEWLDYRATMNLPASAPLFCVVTGPTKGRPSYQATVRKRIHELAEKAGVPRRVACHQLRHALAVELAREGVPMHLIQRAITTRRLGTRR